MRWFETREIHGRLLKTSAPRKLRNTTPVNEAILFDSTAKRWLRFRHPDEVVSTREKGLVLSSLHRVEELVHRDSLVAVGFISYEAAPAFDTALCTRPDDAFPLVWFGLYRKVEPFALSSAGSPLFGFGEWKPSVRRDEYDRAIDTIKSYIRAGDTYQVNYSFRLRSRFSGEPLALFQSLMAAQPSSNGAFIETDEFALCSASPELFFSLDGEDIVARPMKGTAPRGLTLAQDREHAAALHRSEKNRAENVMIVDMMRNDFGRIAEIGSVHVPSLFNVERYPTVWQMTSTVAAKTHASVTAIVKALFPCASVTGAPKARTMEIIAELESSPRRIYTGAIGFIAPNRRAQLNVAIRTVLIEKRSGEAEYGVGGGVVWASTAAGEYEECLTKARVLTAARPEFQLFETILCTPSDGLFLLDQHLARLRDSAEYFGFDYSDDAAREALEKVHCRSQPMRVKLLVSLKGTVSVELSPFNVQSAITHVRLSAFPVDSQNIFLYHKTTHRKVYEDASAEMPECDDVILWNERGEITESTIANVVVEIDGEFFTPPVACGLLAGVFREKLLKEGTLKERIVTVAEFKKSPRIFLINSLRQWREARLLS